MKRKNWLDTMAELEKMRKKFYSAKILKIDNQEFASVTVSVLVLNSIFLD